MVLIESLIETLEKRHDAIQHARLPKNLRFLKKGYESHLDPGNLTIIGGQQLFNHGVDFGLKYPNFNVDILLSSPVQRGIDSMYFFAQGRFGREVENKELRVFNDLDQVSWITLLGLRAASTRSTKWRQVIKSFSMNDDVSLTQLEQHIPPFYHRVLE